MSNYAYVHTELECPQCHTILPNIDLVGFCWGYCPGLRPRKDHIYQMGDEIYWKQCKDSSIPPWAYFSDASGNMGDPEIKNLIALDTSKWNNYNMSTSCLSCGQLFGGVGVKIHDGVLHSAWIYLPGEFSDTDDHLIEETDGNLKPMKEWDDHPMTVIQNC